MIEQAKYCVLQYYRINHIDMDMDDIFVVWFCKTLQNWKALVGTKRNDHYFEITYNGDQDETYVDVYSKSKNYVLEDI